jgi:hypothetical protein
MVDGTNEGVRVVLGKALGIKVGSCDGIGVGTEVGDGVGDEVVVGIGVGTGLGNGVTAGDTRVILGGIFTAAREPEEPICQPAVIAIS